MDWLSALEEAREEGRAAVLVTVTAVRGHAPREAGAKMVVTEDAATGTIGGGNLEITVQERARRMLAEGARTPVALEIPLSPHAPTEHGRQCCGGEVAVLLDPQPAPAVVALFGLGHVGHEIARILSRLPLTVHLVDSRPSPLPDGARADLVRGPARLRLHHAPAPETVLRGLPPGAHVLVMTHDHAEDLVLCDEALRRADLGSLGLIGSAAKASRFRGRLRAAGHDDAAVEALRCPIGLPELPGKEPAVIALAVAAQLVPLLRGGAGLPADRAVPDRPAHSPVRSASSSRMVEKSSSP